MPPRLPPITAAHCAMPSLSARRACASTQSSTVTSGNSRPTALPVAGFDVTRPGRAEAAAEVVDADDEEAVGVERLARPDHVVPPADVVGIVGVEARDVMRRVERVADQHRVVARRRQRPVGLVGELEGRQRSPRRRAAAARRSARAATSPRRPRRPRRRRGACRRSWRKRMPWRSPRSVDNKKPDQLRANRVGSGGAVCLLRFSRICNGILEPDGRRAPASWFKSALVAILSRRPWIA